MQKFGSQIWDLPACPSIVMYLPDYLTWAFWCTCDNVVYIQYGHVLYILSFSRYFLSAHFVLATGLGASYTGSLNLYMVWSSLSKFSIILPTLIITFWSPFCWPANQVPSYFHITSISPPYPPACLQYFFMNTFMGFMSPTILLLISTTCSICMHDSAFYLCS